MKVIVGLGNPGRIFRTTRHNLGFRVIDKFRKRNGLPEFKSSKEFNSLLSRGSFNKEKIIALDPKNLIVIHDDLDLPLGKIRVSKAKGAAGHKGVQSIINKLGTKKFFRFRVGILPQQGKPQGVKKFVLKSFTRKEEKIIKRVVEETVEAVEFSLREGLERAMQDYNK
ncbi:hypothetical protein AMJ50_02960 [Parcubacteria bacterium DG_74_3]|nr:MAG: hypothetical protein AMJ50_02960 [Parcubacteria bacterium DG_74_3]